MDRIPLEEQRVIDELVELWKTRCEPRDLIIHIDRLSGSWGSGICTSFFRQVYKDLRSGKRSKYAISSASGFKEFLEAEYHQEAKAHAERKAQAQVKAEAERKARLKTEAEWRAHAKAEAERKALTEAKAVEERQKRARAEFNALGQRMTIATTREELVKLGRKREYLALYTGDSYVYDRHCWRCKNLISPEIHPRCPDCRRYICGSCDACRCGLYLNYCWKCATFISSESNAECPFCKWYICGECSECLCGYRGRHKYDGGQNSNWPMFI